MLLRSILSAAVVCSVCSSLATAQSHSYSLESGSTYERGCHDPCACPILFHGALSGSFRLTYLNSDPLYDHYSVTNVDCSAFGRSITGSGTYRVGGEVALHQQMILTLDDAGMVSDFDSGLRPVAVPFPDLDITISNQIGTECFYTVIRFVASPSCSADFDGDDDTGTDLDIQAFFACIGGNCCATCQPADFDGDGDSATDFDIQAFFRVLGGGNC